MTPADRSFDSITVGKEASIVRAIRADDIAIFRALSGGDQSPIHTDPAFARAHGFKEPVAYGAMLGAFLSQLLGTLPGRRTLCVTQSFEFKKPLYAGDTVRMSVVVIGKSAATRLIELAITVSRGEETVATGSTKARILE